MTKLCKLQRMYSQMTLLFVEPFEYTHKQKHNFEKKEPVTDEQKPEQNNNSTNIM